MASAQEKMKAWLIDLGYDKEGLAVFRSESGFYASSLTIEMFISKTKYFIGIIDAQNNWHPAPKFEDDPPEEHPLDRLFSKIINWSPEGHEYQQAMINHIKALEKKLEGKC